MTDSNQHERTTVSTPEQKGDTAAPRRRRPKARPRAGWPSPWPARRLALSGREPAMAAGGHHAVDDAAMPSRSNCKIEGWVSSEDSGERLAHAGSGCRVGPVELNAAATYAREHEGGSRPATALQGKWATDVARGFSADCCWPAAGRRTPSRLDGRHGIHLVHLDAARRPGVPYERGPRLREPRRQTWTIRAWPWNGPPRRDGRSLAERFVQLQTQYLRGGLRWAVNEAWTIDLSRAHSLSGRFGSIWTIGTSWQCDRR